MLNLTKQRWCVYRDRRYLRNLSWGGHHWVGNIANAQPFTRGAAKCAAKALKGHAVPLPELETHPVLRVSMKATLPPPDEMAESCRGALCKGVTKHMNHITDCLADVVAATIYSEVATMYRLLKEQPLSREAGQ